MRKKVQWHYKVISSPLCFCVFKWRTVEAEVTDNFCVTAPSSGNRPMCPVVGSTLWHRPVSLLQTHGRSTEAFFLFATRGANMLFFRGLSQLSHNQSSKTWTQHFSKFKFPLTQLKLTPLSCTHLRGKTSPVETQFAHVNAQKILWARSPSPAALNARNKCNLFLLCCRLGPPYTHAERDEGRLHFPFDKWL